MALRPDRFASFMRGWLMENVDPDSRDMLEAELAAPLPTATTTPPTREEVENEMEDFGALYAQLHAAG